jgi:hypothetical protein
MHSIHLHDATLDEENSYNFLSLYSLEKTFRYTYKYPDISLNDVYILSSNFALFYAKVKDSKSDFILSTNVPIHVFRYIMLEDGSWSNYYSIKKKPGYVVEGMYWSNGMMYQVREDKKVDFKIYEIVLSIDSYTKTMHLFPDIEINNGVPTPSA